jgi:hypothetical protein
MAADIANPAKGTHLKHGISAVYTSVALITSKCLFDPKGATQAILLGLIQTPTSDVQWQMLFADVAPSTATFLGILTKFNPTGIEVEKNLEAEFSIKVSGPVTWA